MSSLDKLLLRSISLSSCDMVDIFPFRLLETSTTADFPEASLPDFNNTNQPQATDGFFCHLEHLQKKIGQLTHACLHVNIKLGGPNP